MIETLLGETPKSEFIDGFLFKQPFSRPGGAGHLVELADWEVVRNILADDGVDAMLAREGELWQGESPPSYDDARRLHEDGYTLVIRHAQRHERRLAELAGGFERDFLAPVNVHVYCTPGGRHGFGWHYDAEDVFIIQTTGRKEYSLRKNTVNPWPLVETIPHDMQFDRELMPVMKCTLSAGDWLYIPAGYWHVGHSQEAAISLAVGVMSAAAIDVWDFLRWRLLDSLLWRQRLPVAADAADVNQEQVLAAYREVFSQLADDLQRQFADEDLPERFLRYRRGDVGREGG